MFKPIRLCREPDINRTSPVQVDASQFRCADSQAVGCATMLKAVANKRIRGRSNSITISARAEYGVAWIKSPNTLAPPIPGSIA